MLGVIIGVGGFVWPSVAQVQGQATVIVHVQGNAHFQVRDDGSRFPVPDLHYKRDDVLTLRQRNGSWCVSAIGDPVWPN